MIEFRDEARKMTFLLTPSPSCNKCYGRGNMAWLKGNPIPCPCLEKVYRKELRKLKK